MNPNFTYMTSWCTAEAEENMLKFANEQIEGGVYNNKKGKRFSIYGMIMSVIWPRKTHEKDWYCAELVAAALKRGGIIDASYNPGDATPECLYRMLKKTCATTGNPVVLEKMQNSAMQMPAHLAYNNSTPSFWRTGTKPQYATSTVQAHPQPLELQPLLKQRAEFALRATGNAQQASKPRTGFSMQICSNQPAFSVHRNGRFSAI
tara:strand:+ start:623 stop:1237 length:615 start_codon:yes stop_codon:yes gene_type:complete